MATQKQIEANRRNAQHSTGPRTQEGKDRVRLNAVKHGMTAKTVVLPGEDEEVYLEKLAAWSADFQPKDELEEAVIEDAVQAWWLRQRCRRVGTAQLTRRIRHAASDFAFQQSGAALALGRRLLDSIGSPSPSEHPELLVHQLETSYSGCDWLLDRWGALRALLDRGQIWTPEHKLQAVTLLGKRVEHQDHELIMALADNDDPKAKLHRQRLIDTYFDQPIPENQSHHLAVLRRIVDRTTSRLELLLADHKERLDADVEALGDLMGFDASDEAERLRRYEQSSGRDFYRAINSLMTIRRTGLEPNPTTTGKRGAPAGHEPAGRSPAIDTQTAAPPVADPDGPIPATITTAPGGFGERPAPGPEQTEIPCETPAIDHAAAAPTFPEADAAREGQTVLEADAARGGNVGRNDHAARDGNRAGVANVVWTVLALWAVMAAGAVGAVRAVNVTRAVNVDRESEAPTELLPTPAESPFSASRSSEPQSRGGTADSINDESNPISLGSAAPHIVELARLKRPRTTDYGPRTKVTWRPSRVTENRPARDPRNLDAGRSRGLTSGLLFTRDGRSGSARAVPLCGRSQGGAAFAPVSGEPDSRDIPCRWIRSACRPSS
jgi:hypothetical protein